MLLQLALLGLLAVTANAALGTAQDDVVVTAMKARVEELKEGAKMEAKKVENASEMFKMIPEADAKRGVPEMAPDLKSVAEQPKAESAMESKTEPKLVSEVDTKTDSKTPDTTLELNTEPKAESKTEPKMVAAMTESLASIGHVGTSVSVVGDMQSTDRKEPFADPRSAGRALHVEAPERFDGHVVLKVSPSTPQHLEALRTLFESDEIDVWKEPSVVGEDVHFRIPPAEFNWTTSYLDGKSLKYDTIIADVQRVIDSQTDSTRAGPADGFGWNEYYRLDTIYRWMESVVARHPAVATLVRGGLSSEGRQILGVRIAHGRDLPVIYLEGGIHGREWISPAATTFILDALLNSQDPRVVRAASSFEWHIFPSVNPDAYEFSHTTNRLWRKSRKRTTFRCYGADLNRNFHHQWGTVGVSWNMCSDVFPGTRAESEIETRTRVQYMEPLLPRMKAFVALHSYGQYLLFPWGHTFDRAANHDALLKVASTAAQAFAARHGTVLRVGNLAATLYPASGSSMDWAHSQRVPFAYTLELRDRGEFGFLLPAGLIAPAVEETLDGVVALVEAVQAETQRG